MSNLFISNELRPQVGPQRSRNLGGKVLCPLPDFQDPSDSVHKRNEKWNEKNREKLFQEKLGDIKRHGEKLGDKGCREKLGDKHHGEKLGDIKRCGEKLGDKRHGEKFGEKLGDIKRCGEKLGDKRHGEKFGEKLDDKFHGEKFGEKLGEHKGCAEKLGDKLYSEKTHEKGCFEKNLEIRPLSSPDLSGAIPSDRFFVKRG